METFLMMSPRVRYAAFYTFKRALHESQRQGSNYAFHLMTEGKGQITVDQHSYTVEKDDLIFIQPGISHHFSFASSTPRSSCLNIYAELWPEDPANWEPRMGNKLVLAPLTMPRELCTPQHVCSPVDQFPTFSSLRTSPELRDRFEHINNIFEQEEATNYREHWLSSLMKAWLMEWHLFLQRHVTSDYRIRQLLATIETNPEQHLTTEEMCEHTGLEKSHFYKLFHQAAGVTPKEYMLNYRIKKARSLLAETDHSITRIAEILGYDSIHYFSRQFSFSTGMSPTHYRNEVTRMP